MSLSLIKNKFRFVAKILFLTEALWILAICCDDFIQDPQS